MVAAASAVAVVSALSAGQPQALGRGAFRPPPRGLLAAGELRFTRLSPSRQSRVKVTPARADEIAKAFAGGGRWRVVFESLGGYVDDNRIVHDWVGTTSGVPTPLPAYLVRITGGSIPMLGPVDGPGSDHYWNVIVNAATGHVVSAFAYD